jgi:hypothetical protein
MTLDLRHPTYGSIPSFAEQSTDRCRRKEVNSQWMAALFVAQQSEAL